MFFTFYSQLPTMPPPTVSSNPSLNFKKSYIFACYFSGHQSLEYEPGDDKSMELKMKSEADDERYQVPVAPRPVEGCDITCDHLRFVKELGSGQYGMVWLADTKISKGDVVITKVAVKTTKGKFGL